jgi:hypothetical protein
LPTERYTIQGDGSNANTRATSTAPHTAMPTTAHQPWSSSLPSGNTTNDNLAANNTPGTPIHDPT